MVFAPSDFAISLHKKKLRKQNVLKTKLYGYLTLVIEVEKGSEVETESY